MVASRSYFSGSRVSLLLLGALTGLTLPACAQQSKKPLTPVAAVTPNVTGNNGVWLGHAFLTTASVVKTVPSVGDFLHEHRVSTWFVNMGQLDAQGHFNKGKAAVPQVVAFLDAVGAWEKASGQKVKLVAWLSGTLDAASPRVIDLAKPGVRATIIEESLRFVDPAREGSFIRGATRAFDGIQYDMEPSGEEAKAADLGTLLDELRAKAPQGMLTSFCAHKYGENKGRYWWSPALFYTLASKVDLLCVMSYDTGITDEAEYRKLMATQVTGSLHAASGATWKNDAAHPRPAKTAQIMLGFPGFPTNKYHNPKVETMTAAAQGAHDGLEALRAAKDPDLTAFAGAAVYLYTDGTGKDSYSSPAGWQAFKKRLAKITVKGDFSCKSLHKDMARHVPTVGAR